MYKPIEIKISDFSGGISDNPRVSSANSFIISKMFDIFSDTKKLTPYRSLESDTETSVSATDLKQYYVKDFVYASTSAKLYGLGQNATGQTKILQKADATTGLWTKPANSEGNGAVQYGCLVEYKNYLWGFQGVNQVFKYGLLSGTPTITDSAGTTGTITSVAQGVIAKDDNLYLPYNNILVRVNAGGTVQDTVLTLPTNLKITSICNYGNYLAIGCAPFSTYNGNSRIFLWNLTSPDVQEAIDWGEGELRILETIEGMIVGVTDRYLNNVVGAGRGSMIIQVYSGGTPQVIKEVFTQKLNGKTIPLSKSVKNNRVFFSAKIMTNSAGTTYDEGIWSFGRKNVNYPWALTLDVIDENVTTEGIQSFGMAGNYFFLAFNNDGSVDKTNDVATYTFTSIYESQIFDIGDANLDKQLLKITLTTTPLPASSSVTIKYKVNEVTSWTTIGTINTTNKMSRDFLSIEATDTSFATFKEIKFRIESVGGAELTGFRLSVQPLTGSEN